ncbi:FliM/FliN family flagellar motor C-terminal domain-containing protein [Caballeronia sp. LjRoot31]|uniref:FliM/FliN family flagellar motor C-terminal domain-containing protein n=1 Tax=Caballeronia sp. LjRoot31 TaxID=3342324 RepID=UPI003ECC5F46
MSRSNQLSIGSFTSSQPVVLDPCTLGRPFHLLDDFNGRLGRQVDRVLSSRFNRRRGAAFAVSGVSTASCAAPSGGAVWRGIELPTGGVAVKIARRMLLAMLDCHYGNKGSTLFDDATPETETEHRFGALISTALLDALITCIEPSPDLTLLTKPVAPPERGRRVIRVEIREPALGLADALEFTLDDAWLSRLFASVAPARASASPASSFNAMRHSPLADRIPITVSVRMLSRDLRLDELFNLAPGDILPVRVSDTAEVLVEGSRLYRAVIAEQGGSLWLTSFEDVE